MQQEMTDVVIVQSRTLKIRMALVRSSPRKYQHPVFTGWVPFLRPNQQCQSTKGNNTHTHKKERKNSNKHQLRTCQRRDNVQGRRSQSATSCSTSKANIILCMKQFAVIESFYTLINRLTNEQQTCLTMISLIFIISLSIIISRRTGFQGLHFHAAVLTTDICKKRALPYTKLNNFHTVIMTTGKLQ